MKQTILRVLEEATKGVPDDLNILFHTVEREEAITLTDTEVLNAEGADASAERKIVRKERVKELTPLGKVFVNTMLDHAEAKKADELSMHDDHKIGEYSYPNIGLTKLINLSRRAFYNVDKFESNEGELLCYPEINADEFYYNEEGEIEVMDVETFTNTWNRVLKNSKVLNTTSCNTKLNKPVLYWENVNVALNEAGELLKKVGTNPSRDERLLAQLSKATWLVDADMFLTKGVTQLSDQAELDWLIGLGNTNNNNNHKGAKSNNPRRNKFKQNNGRANAQNPNANLDYQIEQSKEAKLNN